MEEGTKDPYFQIFLWSILSWAGMMISCIFLGISAASNQEVFFNYGIPNTIGVLMIIAAIASPVLLLFITIFAFTPNIKRQELLIFVALGLYIISSLCLYQAKVLCQTADFGKLATVALEFLMNKGSSKTLTVEMLTKGIEETYNSASNNAFAALVVNSIFSFGVVFYVIKLPFTLLLKRSEAKQQLEEKKRE